MRNPRGWFWGTGLLWLGLACEGSGLLPPGIGGGGGGTGTPGDSVAVTVGNIFFQSARNNTVNPAIDTVTVGGSVFWTWVNTAAVSHSILSTGTPTFASSTVSTGSGNLYSVRFTTAGTYSYQCGVHGTQMTGVIVVQ